MASVEYNVHFVVIKPRWSDKTRNSRVSIIQGYSVFEEIRKILALTASTMSESVNIDEIDVISLRKVS